jgi:hypothetical protein
LVFTNGLKCRNKCEVASIPCFCFPTGLILSPQKRSPLNKPTAPNSDRLKYPYHHTSDRPSTNQQHQTAIAPTNNNIKKENYMSYVEFKQ